MVAEHRPIRLGEQFSDGELHFHRVGLLCPAEPADKTPEVRVDRDAGDAEGVAEDHVGGLATHSGQFHQVFQPRWHLAVVVSQQRCAEFEQRLGLGPEESQRADDPFEVGPVGTGHSSRIGVRREQRRSHGIHAPVRRLGAQYRDH